MADAHRRPSAPPVDQKIEMCEDTGLTHHPLGGDKTGQPYQWNLTKSKEPRKVAINVNTHNLPQICPTCGNKAEVRWFIQLPESIQNRAWWPNPEKSYRVVCGGGCGVVWKYQKK